jgi:peptidyl-prolyl cis-trans isomerase SurA
MLTRVLLWIFLLITPARAEMFDRIVARVNNDIITLSFVQDKFAYMQHTGGLAPLAGKSKEDAMEYVLDGIIEEKLQVQEAKKYQLKVNEETILSAIDEIKAKNGFTDESLAKMLANERTTTEQYKEKIREQILISKVSGFQMRSRIKVSEKDMRRYHTEHQNDFRSVAKVRPRHILFIFDEGISAEAKQAKALKAKEALAALKGGADFADTAKKYSEDVSASKGGDLGFLERGKMVAPFEQAVFNLKPGLISDIVQTPYGLHIIKLEELIPERVKTFEEVKAEIEQILFQGKREKEFNSWIKELRNAAFVEVTLFPGYDERRKARLNPDALTPTQTAKADMGDDFFDSDAPIKNGKKGKNGVFQSASVNNAKVVADKNSKSAISRADFADMKKKLADIKELRDRNKITEAEYQKRKKELLNEL